MTPSTLSQLTAATGAEFDKRGLVADRRAAGRTVLIVSHFLVDQERFDRIIEVTDGLAVPR